ncbi:glycosyltransferase [Leifsonia sp. F6_8S_P_1B]|uniref:Glycosyltransferase n=1 Tax=Leifsonia williamsii TaxID=3035919 RepID=A0ABT8K784_9MICO|nr:glycosyltransferase [Leifsonia williamsii]MDN4612892.1 glycosyltransferase [Leifsonia williamsii]
MAASRFAARCAALAFGGLVTATDLLPPRLRYAYVHPVTRRLFRRSLPSLGPIAERRAPGEAAGTASAEPPLLTCAMVTGLIEVGGIGSVIEMLATALPGAGVGVLVLSTDDGPRAARLRARGVEVVACGTAEEAERVLRERAPDVIQLHGAPDHLEDAALASGLPLVPVLHNTEIHFTPARWRRFGDLLAHSHAAVAVSETVRAFHAAHVPEHLRSHILVVPNAALSAGPPSPEERRAARAALGRVLGADLGDAVVLASLIRYDSQKNASGLVSSFLAHVTDPSVRLVIAGDAWDWAELGRADAIRRSAADPARVGLLGQSDARTLLAAADVFILDSFFEGWPIAATEAAATGLPLVLADFGGARELVARDAGRSVLIPNPTGPADAVSDAAVARARRRTRHQPNAAELGAAVDAIASRSPEERRTHPTPAADLLAAMAAGHADVLAAAAAARDDVTRPIGRRA